MSRERTQERTKRIEYVLSKRQPDLTLVLANVHDPHNVSAIYRSADAFGVEKIHLYYTDTPFPTLSGVSSASAKKWVDTQRHDDVKELVANLKSQNMQVLATSCTPSARPLSSFDLIKPTAIILGNEHRGVDPEFTGVVDAEVYIPMYGMIQSFNVSVAAAIMLSEASRQRLAAGKYDQPQYSEAVLQEKIRTWLEK
ncbi:TrmH family RNA methyltransferase [Desulfovibrio litoralis]|uniref:tRNA (guanosine(18)-2'-O)-methyltransferase n=1 Tax=Desulfovibrio litoralis DSM 11393 TaxID=1121455 RepID=A0A1M7TFM9_9BACT|nr:RNA methyltransferase [Desulfovibrio litoralis]SHN69527.1 tRNA (guanosine-2'-O-)-methyltransferase [Desulfovibrio litoralis DSM 11393]